MKITYQQYYSKLQKELAEKASMLEKHTEELADFHGFGELNDIPKYARTYKEWQVAWNNYFNFLASIKGKNVNPNDIIADLPEAINI